MRSSPMTGVLVLLGVAACHDAGQGRDHANDVPLFPVRVDGKYGYIDTTGSLAIEPRFEAAARFFEGRAQVIEGGKLGFIDGTGVTVIAPQFDDSGPFSEDLAWVRTGAAHAFIDRSGQVVLSGFVFVGSWGRPRFSEGLTTFRDDNEKLGAIDRQGNIAFHGVYETLGPFVDGLAQVRNRDSDDNITAGFVDKTGRLVLDLSAVGVPTSDFSEGMATFVAKDSSRGGFVDRHGKVVIPATFASVAAFSEGKALAVTVEQELGFIDKTGAFVIAPEFQYINTTTLSGDNASRFDEGMAAVARDDKFGYIDSRGVWVIPPQFDQAWPFASGIAHVRISSPGTGRLDGYIDRSGAFVWAPSR